MTILVTGFEAFDTVTDNPSQRIIEHFAHQNRTDISTQVLPVDYKVAGQKLIAAIDLHQPKAILLIGVAQKRRKIALERIAVNINDASIPDNDGNLVIGKQIIEGAPVGYWSTLPLDAMYEAIKGAGIPVKYSNHAGAYLCNHVMYVALHYLAETNQTQIPCGFIHVPRVEFVPLETQIRAIELCVKVLMRERIASYTEFRKDRMYFDNAQ